MKKTKKNRSRIIFVVSVATFLTIFMSSCKKTYDIQEVPSQVTWTQNIKDQVKNVRQSKNNAEAKKNLELNNLPLRVLKAIPTLADKLNLSWADKIESADLSLALFTAEDELTLLNESEDKKFKVNLNGYEPGFIVEYNGKKHYYLLESFTKILNETELNLLFSQEYREYQKMKTSKVVRSVEFKNNFYPCSIYDNIDYWIKLSKQEGIKLLGRFNRSDFSWDNIPYDEALDYVKMGYVIILDLPQNSSYVKLQSGEEFIKTPQRKIALNLP
jgi:ribosomal protein L24E